MNFIASVAIILGVALAVSGREIPESRIVGGYTAKNGAYPYTVSLRVYFEHFCGGSILNNRWILTAAHCLEEKEAHQVSVIAGTNLLSEAGQMYQAILIIPHPNYDAKKYLNDIALILVSREIVFTKKIKPIALPTKDSVAAGDPAIVTGWGLNADNGALQERLQAAELKIISQTECKSKQSLATSSHICTLTKVGQGVCNGDGGGPLVVDDTQVGIVAFGSVKCAVGQPDVYTKVWNFVDWINKSIADNDWDLVKH